MSLLDCIKEYFRPELQVDQEIVERERRFNEEDDTREQWILDHVYLCRGGLDELKGHPDYHDFDVTNTGVYFPTAKQPKKVRVGVIIGSEEEVKIEDKLKLAIKYRGCNAGIYYKTYEDGDLLIAEATPAMLSGE